jgi:peroxiredoxin
MAELREFAQHKSEFDAANAELIAIGPDDPARAKKVWEGPANKAFQILMDRDYKVISSFGLKDKEGTKRTVVVLDENGNEIFRKSANGVDESKFPAEVLAVLKQPK